VGVGLDVLTRLDIKPKKHKGERAARARSNSLARAGSKLESDNCMSPGRLNDDFGLLRSESGDSRGFGNS
jgi:hypothetical protein